MNTTNCVYEYIECQLYKVDLIDKKINKIARNSLYNYKYGAFDRDYNAICQLINDKKNVYKHLLFMGKKAKYLKPNVLRVFKLMCKWYHYNDIVKIENISVRQYMRYQAEINEIVLN
jgi:hypothetical protein